MNNSKLFLSAFVVTAFPVAALAESPLYFFSGSAKYFSGDSFNFGVSEEVIQGASLLDVSTNLSFDSGPGFEAGVGLLYKNLRFGLVIDHRNSDTDVTIAAISPSNFDAFQTGDNSSKYEQTGVRFEITYALENSSKFTPYISGRVGVSSIDAEVTNLAPTTPPPTFSESGRVDNVAVWGTPLSYGAIAGLEYEVTDRIRIFAQGEYSRVENLSASFDGRAGVNVPCDVVFGPGVFCFAPIIQQVTFSEQVEDLSTDGFNAAAGFRVFF